MTTNYKATPFDSGYGYFITGGKIGETLIKHKADAEQIVEALNSPQPEKTTALEAEIQKLKQLCDDLIFTQQAVAECIVKDNEGALREYLKWSQQTLNNQLSRAKSIYN